MPPSWLTVLVAVIEHKRLVGRRWRAKGRGQDSVYLFHQFLLLGANRAQDGFLGQVGSLEGGVELSEDNRVFTKLGLEQLIQNAGGGRGVGFRIEGFGDSSVLLDNTGKYTWMEYLAIE